MTETIGAYTLHQPDGTPRLSTDTLALADFVLVKPGERVCDLGCGSGSLSLLLLSRQPSLRVTAVDKQSACVAAALQNVSCNALEDSLTVVPADWETDALPANSFDAVVSNPPYFAPHSGAISPDIGRAAARTASQDGLMAFGRACGRLVRYGGRAALVYPAPQLNALLAVLTACKLEPKRLQFVHHDLSKDASLVLVETRLGGRPGLRVLPPRVLSQAPVHY